MSLYNKVFQYITESWISFKEEDAAADNTANQNASSQQTNDADTANNTTDQTQNQDQNTNDKKTKPQPNLDWKIVPNSAIMYNGDKSNPNAMVWIFANQVNMGYNKEWLEKANKEQQNPKDPSLLDKAKSHIKPNVKDDLKKFASAALLGAAVTQGIQAVTDFLDKDAEKTKTAKKNKNSKNEDDKIASLFSPDNIITFEISDFNNSEKLESGFKNVSIYLFHIPEDLLNQYIAKIQTLIQERDKQNAKAASAAKKQAKTKLKTNAK